MEIQVYVCPTQGCGSYFGSSSAGDLSEQVVGQRGANYEPRPPSKWHTRAACPECRSRGEEIERVSITVQVDLPALRALVASEKA